MFHEPILLAMTTQLSMPIQTKFVSKNDTYDALKTLALRRLKCVHFGIRRNMACPAGGL